MNLRHGCHKRTPISCWIVAALAAAVVLPGAAGSFAQSPERDKTKEWQALPGIEVAPKFDPNVQPAGFELVDKSKVQQQKTTRIYDVADLLMKMRQEEDWPEDAPQAQVKLGLLSLLQSGAGISPDNPELAPGLGTKFRWSGDRLVVSATTAEHDLVAKEIAVRREHSFRQIAIEVRIIGADPSLCEPSGSDAEEGEVPDWRDRWILFQQEFANLETKPSVETLDPVYGEIAAQQKGFEPSPLAVASTGTSHPIVYQFASDQQMRSFIGGVQGDARANVMLAPKVTLFDGQTALISDTSQRPFVTDVQKVVGNDAVAYQPVIKVLWEGTKIQLSPSITPDGHRLNCKIMFAAITDCKQFRPARYPEAKDIRIQHPVSKTESFQCATEIPAGKTLLIGGLFPTKKQRTEQQSSLARWLGQSPKKIVHEEMTYIAITPRTIESE